MKKRRKHIASEEAESGDLIAETFLKTRSPHGAGTWKIMVLKTTGALIYPGAHMELGHGKTSDNYGMILLKYLI